MLEKPLKRLSKGKWARRQARRAGQIIKSVKQHKREYSFLGREMKDRARKVIRQISDQTDK